MLLAPPARFELPGSVGLCNAVRRTLLSDVRTEAPASVRVVRNVTCLTDEFLAHRVGLVPFRRVGNGDTLSLDVVGPRVVTAADLVGPAFDPVFPSIALAELRAGHALSLVVTFDERPASAHARYSPCVAVGMRPLGEDRHLLQFASNDHRSPEALLDEALAHLDARVDRALASLSDETTQRTSYI